MSIALLELAADCLGELAEQVTFLGGASVAIWITDPAASPIRPTDDVDVVLTATYVELDAFAERLRGRGFRDDGEVICRYRHPAGLVLDVMPIDPRVLGFGNRWYGDAVAHAHPVPLASARTIRAVRPPWLVATKIEAYLARGGGDPVASADFEDLVRLVDGREELIEEIASAPLPLRRYVAAEMGKLARASDFEESIEAALPPDAGSRDRAQIVVARWRSIVPGPSQPPSSA